MRLTGWEEKLTARIRQAADEPFVRGVNDCCLFAADCVAICIGVDIAKEYRGAYSTLDEAKECLVRFGKGKLKESTEAVMQFLGQVTVPATFASRGDLCYLIVEGSPALGIVDMTGRHIVVTGPNGLYRLPLTFGLQFWRIG